MMRTMRRRGLRKVKNKKYEGAKSVKMKNATLTPLSDKV